MPVFPDITLFIYFQILFSILGGHQEEGLHLKVGVVWPEPFVL
jgi:hypothetical protein